MIRVPPFPFRGRRRARRAQAAPSVALTLVEAAFDEGAPSVRLVFDRAIDIAGLAGAQIVVDAGNVTGTRYEAVGEANLDSPDAVVIGLLEVGPSSSVDTLLTASAGTGIVAVEGGGTWAGVTELALPFP